MSCKHSLRIGLLCCDCGEEISDDTKLYNVLHNNPDIKLSEEEAFIRNKKTIEDLHQSKKLILVLDLDQTILHTTITKEYMEGYYNFIINDISYCVKLRPYLNYMLECLYKKYEIHVYTMGSKVYAKKIVKIIDPSKKYIGNRILSRDENGLGFKKDLNRLFSIHSNVVILDDRDDIWDYSSNLILVKPFFYWDIGDINSN
ncbi:RNA polymerase II subunit A C-terminal domain phosphatase (FCP1) [Vairimorpha necatrix]|uniref:protein-serine/threonine phosphatase n=1 Tax=Vairimorpha necatrix TaxID=6039 RepID=A0AAX4JAS4_9MICR